MHNYEVSMLRLKSQSVVRHRGENTTETNNSTRRSADNEQGRMRRIKRFCMCTIPRCCPRRDDQLRKSRANRATWSQKRAIIHMATGYAFAWALVWIPFMIVFFLQESYATEMLHSCLTPLQGLFNFLVFMSPKVRNAKRPRRGENLTWCQAFIKAYMSRGERRRTGGILSSRNNRTAGSRVLSWNQRVQRSLKSLLSRTRSTRDTSRSNESNNARTTT